MPDWKNIDKILDLIIIGKQTEKDIESLRQLLRGASHFFKFQQIVKILNAQPLRSLRFENLCFNRKIKLGMHPHQSIRSRISGIHHQLNV